jgi:hypothetical protein
MPYIPESKYPLKYSCRKQETKTTESIKEIEMARRIAEAVAEDKRLRATFVGIIFTGLALVAIIVFASTMHI